MVRNYPIIIIFSLAISIPCFGGVVEPLQFTVKTRDLQRFMDFIQPLPIMDYHYQTLDPDTTRVTVTPLPTLASVSPLTPGNSIAPPTLSGQSNPSPNPAMKALNPVTLKCRLEHREKMQDNMVRHDISIQKFSQEKNGRLIYLLELPPGDPLKLMKRFFGDLPYKYIEKNLIFTVR